MSESTFSTTFILAFIMLSLSGTASLAQMSFMIEPGSVQLLKPETDDFDALEISDLDSDDSGGKVRESKVFSPGSELVFSYKIKLDAPLSILAFENREAYEAHADAYQNGMPSPVQLNYIFYLTRETETRKKQPASQEPSSLWNKRVLVVKQAPIDEHMPRGSFDQDNDSPLEVSRHHFRVPRKIGRYTLYYCQMHLFSLSKPTNAMLLKQLETKPDSLCQKKLVSFKVTRMHQAFKAQREEHLSRP